jgi:hypothetical protein
VFFRRDVFRVSLTLFGKGMFFARGTKQQADRNNEDGVAKQKSHNALAH